jgi:hypothetical protein
VPALHRLVRKVTSRWVHQILKNDPSFGAVILIGLNDSEPLTILDGNHRVNAARLASPDSLRSIRVQCGLAPRMVLDCSKLCRVDNAAFYFLFSSLEEALKRNDDVMLAAIPKEA